jgi:hypothetical protein
MHLKRCATLALACLLLTGCSMLRTLLPGGPTMADAEWDGVKSGEPMSIIGTLDSRAEAATLLLQALGQADPLGVILPVTPIGQSLPRWVLCKDELAAKCRAIPLNAEVHFSGQVIGSGPLWLPTRLTASHHDD